jgi:Zn-dependent protease/predicted transcriptional regulator
MQSFRLGSIFGFEIRIALSWFIIFFLILWTLTTGFFPTTYPGLTSITYTLMGVVGTVLFFTSLLAHELSHSMVARAKGIPVEGITLFAFGGVARIRREAETPGDEFQIAGVGPLTSIAIAGLFGSIWWFGRTAGWSIAVNGVSAYLASINLLLAVFNLLPGFPLDGGRLFRSIIWKITGNLRKATRIATAAGRFFGYLLMGWGVVQLFGPAFFNGLWLILIGWFLSVAADTSYQQLVIRTSLAGISAREVMTPTPETVSDHLSLQALVDGYFLQRRFDAYPVVSQGRAIGIITLNQVQNIPRNQWRQRTVSTTMTPVESGIVVQEEEPMTQVLQNMEASRIRRVLVLRDGELTGMITAEDITHWLKRRQELKEM